MDYKCSSCGKDGARFYNEGSIKWVVCKECYQKTKESIKEFEYGDKENEKTIKLPDHVRNKKRPWWLEDYQEEYMYCLHCERVWHVSVYEKGFELWKETLEKYGEEKANSRGYCPTRWLHKEDCDGSPIDFVSYEQTRVIDESRFPKKPESGKEYPL